MSSSIKHQDEMVKKVVDLIQKDIDASAKKAMFKVARKAGSDGSTTATLQFSVTVPKKNGSKPVTKFYSCDVSCTKNIMLLAMLTYYLMHVKSLIKMAGRGEPVDAYLDMYRKYYDKKQGAADRYCKGRAVKAPKK